MKQFLYIAAAVVAMLFAVEGKAQATKRVVPLADPYILCDNGTYYAYGTHARDGIEFYISNDMKRWRYGGLALHKMDSYGEKWFWAPEVYKVGEQYIMYYTAENRTCAAVADSPIGPFKQVEQKPMIDGYKNIDNALFIDDDGTPYMFFVHIKKPFDICVTELESNLLTVKPNSTEPCIHATQKWERISKGLVNEGPSVIKHNGIYYMLYSGNGYTNHRYGIGCATAKNIHGPWEKYKDNPLLQFPGELVGAGHGAPFKDKRGRWYYVFHAHHSKDSVHPRKMYITKMGFKGDKLYISPKFFAAEVVD